MLDLIKLVALVSVIGYLIYSVVIGGMKFLSGLKAINALIIFTLMVSFAFVVIGAVVEKIETKKVMAKIADGFMIVTGILFLYYLFK